MYGIPIKILSNSNHICIAYAAFPWSLSPFPFVYLSIKKAFSQIHTEPSPNKTAFLAKLISPPNNKNRKSGKTEKKEKKKKKRPFYSISTEDVLPKRARRLIGLNKENT